MPAKLNKNEASWICAFLNTLSIKYGKAPDNDMYIETTTQNRQMIGSLILSLNKEIKLQSQNGKLYVMDFTLVDYLRQRIMEQFELINSDIPKIQKDI